MVTIQGFAHVTTKTPVVNLYLLLAEILQLEIISKLMSVITTNLCTNILLGIGVSFMGDSGRLRPVIGLKEVITHKAMDGVGLMPNALDISGTSGDISSLEEEDLVV